MVDNACAESAEAAARRHGARYDAPPGAADLRGRHEPRPRADRRRGGACMLNADCFLAEGFLAAAVRPAGRGPAWARWRCACCAREGPGPGRRLAELDAAGMVLDRRRKNGLVGHGDRRGLLPPGRPRPSAPTAPRRSTGARRSRTARSAGEVLDEDMELWATDADLAWRARLRGWRCVYEPRAVAWHIRTYSPSTRARLPRARSAPAVPQPPADGGQERGRARAAPRRRAHRGLRGPRAGPRAAARAPPARRLRRGGAAAAARARRRRAVVQRRRAAASVPFGLQPPADAASS